MLRANSDQAVLDGIDTGEPGLAELFQEWLWAEGLWWLASCVVHLCLCCALALVSVRVATEIYSPNMPIDGELGVPKDDNLPELVPIEAPPPPEEIFPAAADLVLDNPSYTPSSLTDPSTIGGPSDESPSGDGNTGPSSGYIDGNSILTLADIGIGGALKRKGDGEPNGGFISGKPGSPYETRGKRRGPGRGDIAVAAALNWIARHQSLDGRWSMQDYRVRCTGSTCTGAGTHKADTAATAMGLLPFLAAGQTHLNHQPYSKNIEQGLRWLIQNQKSDGNLRGGGSMYAHALATIALCEAYGMSNDRRLEAPARRAVEFILRAQNATTGGWRYAPGEEGDTSVVGWQVMALKSAQMAGISVDPAAFAQSQKYLKSVSSGRQGSLVGGHFAYQPGQAPTPSMTSVGLLCLQYMGTPRNDAAMVDGTAMLMQNVPNAKSRDIYYWYYASQVMHNQPGPEWDSWDRTTRRILIESQQRKGCEAGSWDPKGDAPDRWGDAGGRLMVTSLSALTLEVYYRFLPLYKTDADALLALEKK